MRKLIAAGAALTLAVAALVISAPAQAAWPIRECGDLAPKGVGIHNVTTRHFSCREARSIARYWLRTSPAYAPNMHIRKRWLDGYTLDVRMWRYGVPPVRWTRGG
jgi:hypothetical protein